MQKISINVLWAYGQIFLLCFFGEHLSNSFDDLSIDIFHCEWYTFPVKSQRYLSIMLLSSQTSVSIRGFGSTVCSRDSFKMVINWSVKTMPGHILIHFLFSDGQRDILVFYDVAPIGDQSLSLGRNSVIYWLNIDSIHCKLGLMMIDEIFTTL